ncbi:hypothetical protein [Barnesiella sp. CU968]|jgi:hypothetical protein|uniref:hypothetical protein n=1 Tax=Barnesiella sp. CU968 TaxID=2780099 RepID=UPI001EF9F2EF|nr:hypothetical protein [Barnesiella sp. CU968]
MATRNSKTSFTGEELTRIISLVRQLEMADSSKQKGIRNKLRNIGLYWSEVAPGMSYTVENLRLLFEKGTLKLYEQGQSDSSAYNQADVLSDQSKPLSDGAMASEIIPADKHGSRSNSDEHYVIDLCDEILGQTASRQHRFDFLRGDSGKTLPVDAYYSFLKLVIEYHESQHTESTPFFDKKQTVSGVSRGEQRQKYDQLRQEVLPKHGINVVVIPYTAFGSTKKIVRNPQSDKLTIMRILKENGIDL